MLKRLEDKKLNEVITKVSKKAVLEASKKPLMSSTKDKSKDSGVKVNTNKKSVLFVSSEVQPFVATGGLADVVGSLPKELVNLKAGLDVRVMLPLYSEIKAEFKEKMTFVKSFNVPLSWRNVYCGIYELKREGVIYYFVDNEFYYKREGLYNHYDDAERFAFFSSAVVHSLKQLQFVPNVIHCNDWQTALIPAYLKQNIDKKLNDIKTIYTIHNIEYQGSFDPFCYKDVFGLDDRFYDGFFKNDSVNLSKGAIEYCDIVTTVSPTYMEEIKGELASFGLGEVIVKNSHKLKGIVNGIDYDFYNPETDPNLYKNYGLKNFEDKAYNKVMLQKEFGLPVGKDIPVICLVGRLVKTKGVDVVLHVIEEVIENTDIQFLVLGKGDKKYEDALYKLEKKYPDRVRAMVGIFSNEWSRRINAASDGFLMPSINEPCGLSQMIASKYGVVPLVREVGGLKDTIKDFGNVDGGNGFTFSNYNDNDFKYSLYRLINDYKDKKLWKKYMQTIMSQDFSWEKSAKKYLEMYDTLF